MNAPNLKSGLFTAPNGVNYAKLFSLLCALFLLWGFSMGLIDVLNKHFQEILHISKAESAFVQFAYYMGYFLMAIPAGLIAKRFGYKGGILVGLSLVVIGSLWAVPATKISSFTIFLIGLFILACGLSCLETVANPYTTLLGAPEKGATRINFAQSFNALGQILGPLIGGQIILSAVVGQAQDSSGVYIPYLGIAGVVFLLVILFSFVKMPDLHALEECTGELEAARKPVDSGMPFWKRWHFNGAVLAQFFYMIAQTGIFSFFINYTVKNLPGCSDRTASVYLSLGGFGLFLAGRLIGSWILNKTKPHITLAFYGIANVIMMALLVFVGGITGFVGLLGSFFFMSIMFPTIFALGIFGLGEKTKQASSFIVMTLVGGALTPIMGWIADETTINIGFIVPLVCFGVVFAYGILWKRLEARDMATCEI